MIKDDNDDNDSGSGPEWGVDRGRERCRMSVPRDTAVICLICGQTNIILEVAMMLMTMIKFISIIKTIFKSPGQHNHNHDKFDHLCWSSVPRCPAYQWTIEE